MTRPLSKKILAVKASPTIALNAKAAAMLKEGKPVLNFTVGEPHLPTPQVIVDAAMESLKKGRTKYGPAGGGPDLRRGICDKLKRENGFDFAPEQIVVGIGAKEILFHLMLALLNDGDEVIIPAPCWVSYADQVTAAGGVPRITEVPKDFTESPGLDLAAIDKCATSKTCAIILNSPNNPSGYAMSESAVRELGEYLLKKKDWWIISDEIYEYLSFARPHVSLLTLFPELKERFILVNGFSKSYCMTGWRVGYAAGPQPVIKLVQSLQSHSSTCLPGFIEDAAIVAIKAGRDLVTKEIAEMDRLRKVAIEEFRKVPQLSFAEPQGAFYVFLDLRPRNTLELCDELLQKHYVAMVPGEAFGAPGFARFSYSTTEEKIREGVARIAKALA